MKRFIKGNAWNGKQTPSRENHNWISHVPFIYKACLHWTNGLLVTYNPGTGALDSSQRCMCICCYLQDLSCLHITKWGLILIVNLHVKNTNRMHLYSFHPSATHSKSVQCRVKRHRIIAPVPLRSSVNPIYPRSSLRAVSDMSFFECTQTPPPQPPLPSHLNNVSCFWFKAL